MKGASFFVRRGKAAAFIFPAEIFRAAKNAADFSERAGKFPCAPAGMVIKYLRMSGQSSAIGDRHECPVSKEEKIVNIIETLENEERKNPGI